MYRKIASILGPVFLVIGIAGLIYTFISYECGTDRMIDGILRWGTATANGLIITAIVIYKRISK